MVHWGGSGEGGETRQNPRGEGGLCAVVRYTKKVGGGKNMWKKRGCSTARFDTRCRGVGSALNVNASKHNQ